MGTIIISSHKSWIEGEAVRQLEKTAELPGMVLGVGMPDLHPGKGHPIGAAFVTRGVFYPYLIGNDIGCGMALYQTDQLARKVKIDRLVKKLEGIEGPWDGDTCAWRERSSVKESSFDGSLGTIGGGNHFAEILAVDEIHREDLLERMGVDHKKLFLLVHSGSRGYGEYVLRSFVDRFQAACLTEGSEAADEYLSRYEDARLWAQANRALIAERVFHRLGVEGRQVLEVEHNTLTPYTHEGERAWLHRKGAAPADLGPIVIPGSRGSYTYIVQPCGDQAGNAWSLAHGAGRKWKRSEVRARLNCRVEDLEKTSLGSRVICEDKELMFEEAPQAYKKVEQVIADLVGHGLIEVVAKLKPMVTYKTRRPS